MRRKIYVYITLTFLLLLLLYPIQFVHCFFKYGYLRTFYLEGAGLSVRILIIAVMLMIFISVTLKKILFYFERKEWSIWKLFQISIVVYLVVKIFQCSMGVFSGMSTGSIWLRFYNGEIVYPRNLPLFLGVNIYYPIMLLTGAKSIAKQKVNGKYVRFFLWSAVQLFAIWPLIRFYDEYDLVRLIFVIGFAAIVHLMCCNSYLYGGLKLRKRDLAAGVFLAALLGGWLWYINVDDQLIYIWGRLRSAAYLKRGVLSLMGNASWFGAIQDDSVYCPSANTIWFLLKQIGWFGAICYVAIILLVLFILWGVCRKTERKELSSIATMSWILLSLRWGLWLAMSFGIVPYETSYSVQPFYGSMAFYDVLLIGIIIMPVLPEERELQEMAERIGNSFMGIFLKKQWGRAAAGIESAVNHFYDIEIDENPEYDIDEEEWKEFQEWKNNKGR